MYVCIFNLGICLYDIVVGKVKIDRTIFAQSHAARECEMSSFVLSHLLYIYIDSHLQLNISLHTIQEQKTKTNKKNVQKEVKLECVIASPK